jgi:hypothetical protein
MALYRFKVGKLGKSVDRKNLIAVTITLDFGREGLPGLSLAHSLK